MVLAHNGIVDPDAMMMNSRHPGVFSARDLEREAIDGVNMSRLRTSIRLNQRFCWFLLVSDIPLTERHFYDHSIYMHWL